MPWKDLEKKREYLRQYRKINAKKRRKYDCKWRKENIERARERDRRSRNSHREEIRQRDRESYTAHTEREREESRRYRLNHLEKENERQRQYREDHREELRARDRLRYKQANREHWREKARKWRKKHPEKAKEQDCRRRKEKKEYRLMQDAVNKMLRRSNMSKVCQSCQYVGCSPSFLRNHLERQFKTGDDVGESRYCLARRSYSSYFLVAIRERCVFVIRRKSLEQSPTAFWERESIKRKPLCRVKSTSGKTEYTYPKRGGEKMKHLPHLQPVEGAITKGPAPTAPWQPSPVLPAQGTPRAPLPESTTPARGSFQNVPTGSAPLSTVEPHAMEVTTGVPTPVRRQG